MDITLKQVGKRYNSQWLYHNFDYAFSSGNSYAILGKNGSGKSTLLQMIYGYLLPTKGEIQYHLNNVELSGEEASRQIAFAAPYMQPVYDYTLSELLHFHFSLRNAINGLRHEQLADAMEISKRDTVKPVKFFSSGMQQRVRTGLCLLTDSTVKLLDEPLTNMDASGTRWYHELVSMLSPETLIIVASNDEAEYAFCKHSLQLSQPQSENGRNQMQP